MTKTLLKILSIPITLYGCYAMYLGLTELQTSIPNLVNQLTFAWIAIYGGIQLFRLAEIGRKVLVVWSAIAALGLLFSIGYTLFFEPNTPVFFLNWRLSFPNQETFLLIASLLAFGMLVLIGFLANQKTKSMLQDQPQQKFLLGMVLAFFTPGLGRAVVHNIGSGIGAFFVYLLLMSLEISLPGTAHLEGLFNFVYRVVIVWGTSMMIDWRLVTREMRQTLPKSEHTNSPEPEPPHLTPR